MNPYQGLDEKHFWAPAVGRRDMLEIDLLWDPKFNIRRNYKIATFGSCFAQHIGRALRARGYTWQQTEPTPSGLTEENAKKFNYDIFTCRTGNIYTVSLLNQWVNWAIGLSVPPDEVWEKDGRFYDPFRPTIEPGGFASAEELSKSREMAIEAFRTAIKTSTLFVFTLGLTESWSNKRGNYEYPMCPGTVGGVFDPENHTFHNQDFRLILDNLNETLNLMATLNPKLGYILTVSPVPLTATMSGNHVLPATVESKSILRAVAGEIARKRKMVDYFPSYEIISSPPFQGAFYGKNKRSVMPSGVAHVMESFFKCLNHKFETPGGSTATSGNKRAGADSPIDHDKTDDVICDEEFLATFAPSSAPNKTTGDT